MPLSINILSKSKIVCIHQIQSIPLRINIPDCNLLELSPSFNSLISFAGPYSYLPAALMIAPHEPV